MARHGFSLRGKDTLGDGVRNIQLCIENPCKRMSVVYSLHPAGAPVSSRIASPPNLKRKAILDGKSGWRGADAEAFLFIHDLHGKYSGVRLG